MILDESPYALYRPTIMSNIANLSVEQLKHAVSIREQIESLEAELNDIMGAGVDGTSAKGERGMSAAGRARVAAAQKARWAKLKGEIAEKPAKGRRKMSAAAKAKIAAAARERWKKAKAAGKTRL